MLHSRITRVSEQLRDEVSQILLKEMKDPRLGFVTVCGAKVSKSLRHAQVHVSFLDETQAEETLAVLRGARSFIRARLGKRMALKYLPELHFVRDDSARYAGHISRLIDQVRTAEDLAHADDPEQPESAEEQESAENGS